MIAGVVAVWFSVKKKKPIVKFFTFIKLKKKKDIVEFISSTSKRSYLNVLIIAPGGGYLGHKPGIISWREYSFFKGI